MNETPAIPSVVKTPESSNETLLDLKASREAGGFSLSDVFHATRISLVNLNALEGWDFDKLPPPVYTRNFIRKYAQVIGVDEKPILDRYEMHLDRFKPPDEEKEIRRPRLNGRRYFFPFGALAIAIVVGMLVYSLGLHDQFSRLFLATQSGESTPSPEAGAARILEPSQMPLTTPLAESPPLVATTTAAKPTIPAAVAPATPPLSRNKIEKALHLIIEAKELTWARITEDNESPSQVLLKPGDRIERRASDFFLLDIGNAGGIDLVFQGKPLGSIGKRGQVIHIRLPEKEGERKIP